MSDSSETRLRSAFWLLPVLLTAAYASLHVEARHTLPAWPSLLLLAGVGLAGVTNRVLRALSAGRSGTSGGRT